MFDPLFEAYPTRESPFFRTQRQKEAFRWYVDRLLMAGFHYLSLRLRAAGMRLDKPMNWQVDLQWIPEENGFPRPALMEMGFSAL